MSALCSTLPRSLPDVVFLGVFFKSSSSAISDLSKSFPPQSGFPGVLDSGAVLGIIKISDTERSSRHILQAMQPGNNRSGNVCQFSAAGSNGSNLYSKAYFLYVILLVPVRGKLTVIRLTNGAP